MTIRTLLAAGLLLASGVAAQADDLTITLTNGTSATLDQFFTSPVGVNEWEEDVFGQGTLGAGESVSITIADGREVCDYDMRFVFEDGSGLDELTGSADLCETEAFTITE